MKNLFTILFFLSHVAVFGQSLQDYHWQERYIDRFAGNQIGIDYMQIWSICEGVDGYVFAATNAGLTLFDGIRWRHVEDNADMILRALYFDKASGRLYSAGVNSFGYWEMNRCGDMNYVPLFRNEHTREKSIDFWRIVNRQNSSVIYFQSHSAVYEYNTASSRLREIHLPVRGEIHFCLASEDRILLQIGSTLYVLQEDHALSPLCETPGRIMSLLGGERGPVLAIEHLGLFRIEEDGRLLPVSKPLNEHLAMAKINCAMPFHGGYIVGTTRAGLVVVDAEWNVVERSNQSVQTQTILSMCVDSRSDIWLGFNSGIAKIDIGSNERHVFSEQFGQVVSVMPLGDKMLIATNKGVFRVENGSVDLIPGTLGASWKLVRIEQDVFILHDRGLLRLDGERLELVNSGGIMDLVQMVGRKEYWVACNYNGMSLYEYKDRTLKFVSRIEGYDSFPANLVIDRSDNLWIPVRGFGFQRLWLTDEKTRVAGCCDYKTAFDGNTSSKVVFVATLNDEQVFYANNQVYRYDKQTDSLVSDPKVSHLLKVCGADLLTIEQQGSNIWYISQDDIGFLEQAAGEVIKHSGIFEKSRAGRITPRIWRVNENIVIGFNNGIGFIPANTSNYKARRIEVAKVEAIGINTHVTRDNPDEVFEIPYSMNNLKIYPVRIPRGTKVDYRIIGVDQDWNTLKVKDYIWMSALPSGKYTVELRPSGVEDPSKYTYIPINIARPWYASNRAIGLYVVVFLAVLAAVRAYYIRSNRRQQARLKTQQQEKLEREKLVRDKQIAELQKEQIKIELREKDKRLANITMNSIKRNNILNELKADILDVQNMDSPSAVRQRTSKIIRRINTQLADEDDWKKSERYFNTIYDGLLDRLRQEYPNLTKTDLKLCVYIKLNHSTKEIAELMSISPRSIEMARYRLRKKLGLQSSEPIENVLK